jgi:hypothetical protein
VGIGIKKCIKKLKIGSEKILISPERKIGKKITANRARRRFKKILKIKQKIFKNLVKKIKKFDPSSPILFFKKIKKMAKK